MSEKDHNKAAIPLASEENVQADFLSRYRLECWDFKLLHSEYQKVCRKLQVAPTLDAFTSQRCHQVPRFMSWAEEDKAVAVNALVWKWDLVTWLFPPVPLIPEVLLIVEEQKIEAVLICPGWEGSMWWP